MYAISRCQTAAFLVIAGISFSCKSISEYTKSMSEDNIAIVPKDFDPNKHILLFAEMPRLNNPSERNNSVTEKLDKALKKYCPYKYEIVSMKDILENKGKYSDTSIYKYAILNSLNATWNTTTTTTTTTDNTGTHSSSVSPSARVTTIDFNFYDRTTAKNYPPSGKSSSFMEYTVKGFMGVVKKAKGEKE